MVRNGQMVRRSIEYKMVYWYFVKNHDLLDINEHEKEVSQKAPGMLGPYPSLRHVWLYSAKKEDYYFWERVDRCGKGHVMRLVWGVLKIPISACPPLIESC
jgi:hypothetical protein